MTLVHFVLPSGHFHLGHAGTACARKSLALLVLLTLPAVAPAEDYTYTTNRGTITITRYTGPDGDVTIPSTINGYPVTSIEKHAFYGYTNPISVTIPNSITNIGRAFTSCLGLTDVSIGNGVPRIDDHAFDYCINLASVSIGNSVTNIGTSAFSFCRRLTNATIGNAVSRIGNRAFWWCDSLTNVTFGPNVTEIGAYAFQICSSLANIAIPDKVTRIGAMAFSGCASLNTVTIPNSVTNTGGGLFEGCVNLTSATLGSGLTVIGYDEFLGCVRLASITIPDSVTIISNYAFASCLSLTNVTLGLGVTEIGSYAFASCSSLINVMIPESVTSIKGFAFASCTILAGVYCYGNAPSDGGNVFSRADNVTVYYLRGTTGWGPLFSGRPTALWTLPPVADASATEAWLVSPNGLNATALLDGSRSYDPDGDALEYFWSSSPGSELPTLLATGIVAEAVLPLGSHPIDLVVSDGLVASTNSITISVLTTGQAVEGLIRLVDSSVRKSKPLMAVLGAALASIDRGNPVAAANQLRAFEHKVRAQVANPALAGQLLEAAQQVIDAL